MDLNTLKENSLFPVGEENTAFAAYFDGTSYLNMLTTQQVPIGNVTFEPGCRNHWHIHKATQGGAGRSCWSPPAGGYYQEWGQTRPGAPPGRRGEHSPQREALARGRPGQRLPAPGRGGPR